ncbi:MAG TPA: pantoate--beta-alanine ligase [Frankiaceae bacterium]|jgi:pantoate--beta-alanine ligase|nr:pantoate--beta-alanine ligase [Frankiaceae bacterium]
MTTLGTSAKRRSSKLPAGQLPVAQSREELVRERAKLRGPIGLVMTMGALHDGHGSLIREATKFGNVMVTIFVNPLQFGAGEDLDRYPRTLGADLELCARAGACLVFAPTPDVVYPNGSPLVRIDPGPGGAMLEGASRPGHFAGVLTVVNKMLNLTRPDRAYFGEKDFQQLTLIERMVADLDMPVTIEGVPTWRDPDGLAMSSRNRYLSAGHRPTALALSQALAAGSKVAAHGREAVLDAARAAFAAHPDLKVDRLDLVDPVTLEDATSGPSRLLVAGILTGQTGPIRLIDNTALTLGVA